MTKSNKHPSKHDLEWSQAKRLCRLSKDDIRKAKELGFKPRTLISNRPSASQQWKAPVKQWIGELHRRKFPGQQSD